jgi:hypothetical protein
LGPSKSQAQALSRGPSCPPRALIQLVSASPSQQSQRGADPCSVGWGLRRSRLHCCDKPPLARAGAGWMHHSASSLARLFLRARSRNFSTLDWTSPLPCGVSELCLTRFPGSQAAVMKVGRDTREADSSPALHPELGSSGSSSRSSFCSSPSQHHIPPSHHQRDGSGGQAAVAQSTNLTTPRSNRYPSHVNTQIGTQLSSSPANQGTPRE